jgi:hypothetical protein
VGAESKKQEPPPFDADLFRKDDQVFSLHGEFLFWQIWEGSLDYAIKMNQPGWGPANCYAQGKFENASFNGEPGFRIGASFFRAPKYWEIWAGYTRLTGSGRSSAGPKTPGLEYLTPTWPTIYTNATAEAKSHIHMNYNTVDFYVARVFHPNPHLRLRVLGGAAVAWIDQNWRIQFTDTSGLFTTKLQNKWKFVGGGLRMGTMIDWYWGFDVYAAMGCTFSALLGTYTNSSLISTNDQINGSYNPSLFPGNAQFKDARPAYAGQVFFGPAYEKNLKNSRIEFFVGYELNAWMNLQEIYRSSSGAPSDPKTTYINSSMIALQGLTTRLTCDF